MKTELLLLAAGKSQRFNGIKQLADIQGVPMVCHCLDQYRYNGHWLQGLASGHVVLGANATAVSKVLPDFVNRITVDNWYDGMGSSIAGAVKSVVDDTTHLLIGLADQVALTPAHISQLLERSQHYPERIIAAFYAGKFGAPVIFPRIYFKDLAQLSGDKGARNLLNGGTQDIEQVTLSLAAIDIDTQNDLLNFE